MHLFGIPMIRSATLMHVSHNVVRKRNNKIYQTRVNWAVCIFLLLKLSYEMLCIFDVIEERRFWGKKVIE